jgi:ribosomal protein S18 acetylase RimI-like enzyme
MVGEHAEFDDADAASFRFFGVDPSVQGRGVGDAMVQWVIDESRRRGRRRIRIHTLESMPGAQRLYERIGFVRTPDHDENWDGITGLAFVLELAPAAM